MASEEGKAQTISFRRDGVVGLRCDLYFLNQRSLEKATIEGDSPVGEKKIKI